MGRALPPYYGKSKFYENKKAKAVKKIAELKETIKLCDEEIEKAKNSVEK